MYIYEIDDLNGMPVRVRLFATPADGRFWIECDQKLFLDDSVLEEIREAVVKLRKVNDDS